jgi:hypothetical protein
MGVLKNRTLSKPSPIIASYNQHMNKVEPDSDIEPDEEPCDYQEYTPPKRKRGTGYIQPVEEPDTEIIPVTTLIKPMAQQTKPVKHTEDVKKMTTAIRSPLYERLRIYGVREKKTNIQIIESWIEAHCPE